MFLLLVKLYCILLSVKVAYDCRVKAYGRLNTMENTLNKKKETFVKVEGTAKVRVDKLANVKAEIVETSSAIEDASRDFEIITNRLIRDLKKYDVERVKDFSTSLKSFLVNMLETQQKVSRLT